MNMRLSDKPLFLEMEVLLVIRHIVLLMLSRTERKRAVLKQDDGWLYVEHMPEDIAEDQAPVVRMKCRHEKTLEPVFSFEGFAFVGSKVLF